MSRRRFIGGVLGAGGLAALGCAGGRASAPTTITPATTTSTTAAPTTTAAATTTAPPPPVVWDEGRLEELAAFAEARASRSLLLLDDGDVVLERWFGVEPTFRRDVASCQKSVVAVLVGMAQARALLHLDEPVASFLGPDWTNDTAEAAQGITVRHLLSMTSGLDAARRVVAAPGTVWSYGNDAYHQLQPVLETVTGMGIDELCRQWLWAPIGAADSSWAPRSGGGRYAVDAKGAPMWGLSMSAADLARFGLLVQRDGVWDGAAVVDPTYLQEALRASSELNPSYGHLWWLNGAATYRLGADGAAQPGPLIPGAPDDVVAALGKDDQKLYVTRAERLVLVRQGARAGTRSVESLSDFDAELWRLVLAARA